MSAPLFPPPVPVGVFLDEDEERLAEYCFKASSTTTTTTSTTEHHTAAGRHHRAIQFAPTESPLTTGGGEASGDDDATLSPLTNPALQDRLFGGRSTTVLGGVGSSVGADGEEDANIPVGPDYKVGRITRVTTAASNAPPTIAVGDLIRHVEKNCRGVIRYIGPMYSVSISPEEEGILPADDPRRLRSYTAHEAAEWLVWRYALAKKMGGKKKAPSAMDKEEGGDTTTVLTSESPTNNDDVVDEKWDAYCAEMGAKYKGITFGVPDAHAVWFGVQWERPVGKGNGTAQGISYMPPEDKTNNPSSWPEGSITCPVGFGSILKRNKFRTQKSLLRALFQRFSYGSEGATPEAILRPCANVFYREDVSPSSKGANNDEVAVGGGGSCGGGTQHKGYCRRTHGLDPFVRNDLTGQFTNVLLTDCSANESLQSVGFGNEKFVSVHYTRFLLRTARILGGQPPHKKEDDGGGDAEDSDSTITTADPEVMLDVRLNVVTPSCILDGCEEDEDGTSCTHHDNNNMTGSAGGKGFRKYVHHPPHNLVQRKDIITASFLRECFLRAVAGGDSDPTKTLEGGAVDGGYHFHNTQTNTILLSRSRRKHQQQHLETTTTATESHPLPTVSSSASMAIASPVTPFGIVTGDNTLPPHVESMMVETTTTTTTSDTNSKAAVGQRRLGTSREHHRLAMVYHQNMAPPSSSHPSSSNASSPLLSPPSSTTTFPSAQRQAHWDPSITDSKAPGGVVVVGGGDDGYHDRHNILLTAASVADRTLLGDEEVDTSDHEVGRKLLPEPSAFERCFSLHYLFPNLNTLSVSNTLLQSWTDLWDIIVSFPLLRVLNAGKNPLRPFTTSELIHLYDVYGGGSVGGGGDGDVSNNNGIPQSVDNNTTTTTPNTSPSKVPYASTKGVDSALHRLSATGATRTLPQLTGLVVSDTGLTSEMFVFLLGMFPTLNTFSVGSNAPEAARGGFTRLAMGDMTTTTTGGECDGARTPYPHKSFLHPGNMAAGVSSIINHPHPSPTSNAIVGKMFQSATKTLCSSIQILGVGGMDFTVDGDNDTTTTTPAHAGVDIDKWAGLRSSVLATFPSLQGGTLSGTTLQPLLTSLCMIDTAAKHCNNVASEGDDEELVAVPVPVLGIPTTSNNPAADGSYPYVVYSDRVALSRLQVSDCPIRSLAYASYPAVCSASALLLSALPPSTTTTTTTSSQPLTHNRLPATSHIFDTVEAVLAKGCKFSSWDEAFLCLHDGSLNNSKNNTNDDVTTPSSTTPVWPLPPAGDGDGTNHTLLPLSEGMMLDSQCLMRRRCFPRVSDIILTDCPAVDGCGSDIGAQRRHQVCCFPPPPAQGAAAFSSTAATTAATSPQHPNIITVSGGSVSSLSPPSLSGSACPVGLPSSNSNSTSTLLGPVEVTLEIAYMDKLNKSSITKIERSGAERHVIKANGDWYYATAYPLIKAAMVELCVVLCRDLVASRTPSSLPITPLDSELLSKVHTKIGPVAAHYWAAMGEMGALLATLNLPTPTTTTTCSEAEFRQRTLRSIATKANLCVKGFLLDKGSCFADFIRSGLGSSPDGGLPPRVSLHDLFKRYIASPKVPTTTSPGKATTPTSITQSIWVEVLGGLIGAASSNDATLDQQQQGHHDDSDDEEDSSSSDEAPPPPTTTQEDSPLRDVRQRTSKKRCAVTVGAVVSPLSLLEESALCKTTNSNPAAATPITTPTSSTPTPTGSGVPPLPPPTCWLPQLRRLALEAMSEVHNDMCAVADGSVSIKDLIDDEILSNGGGNFRRLGGRVGPAVVQAPPKRIGPLLAINEINVEFTTALLTPQEFLIARACCFHETVQQHLSISKAKRRQRKAKLKEELEGGTIVPQKEPKLTPAMLQQMNNSSEGGGMHTVRSAAALSTDDGGSTSVGTSTIAGAIAAGLVDPLSARKIDPMFEATIDVRWSSSQLQSYLCQQAHLPDVSPYSKDNLAAAAAQQQSDIPTSTNSAAATSTPLSSSIVSKKYLHDDVIDEEDHWSVASLTLYAYLDRTRRILKTNISDAGARNEFSTSNTVSNRDVPHPYKKRGDDDVHRQGDFSDNDHVQKTASAAKEVLMQFPLGGENPAGRRFPPAEYMFPKGSVYMFHISRELIKNEGAVAKGMHCADMIRGGDRVQRFRVSPRDVFVLVLIV